MTAPTRTSRRRSRTRSASRAARGRRRTGHRPHKLSVSSSAGRPRLALDWKRKLKFSLSRRAGLKPDPAAMGIDDRFGYRQTKADALGSRRAEWLEQRAGLFWCDASAVVAHDDFDLVTTLRQSRLEIDAAIG